LGSLSILSVGAADAESMQNPGSGAHMILAMPVILW